MIDSSSDSEANADGLYVQFGAGHSASEHWLSFDNSPTLRLERLPVIGRFVRKNARRFPSAVQYGDIVQGLPLEPESCRALFGSHVLEHLALIDFRKALANCYLLARKDCIVRLVVPDLEFAARSYLGNASEEASLQFMRQTGLGQEKRARGFGAILREYWGNSRHLWMWDYASLASELRKVGFTRIRRCQFGDSSDPKFQLVETQDRFEEALAIEAIK